MYDEYNGFNNGCSLTKTLRDIEMEEYESWLEDNAEMMAQIEFNKWAALEDLP